jgi:anthranilate synthase component 1
MFLPKFTIIIETKTASFHIASIHNKNEKCKIDTILSLILKAQNSNHAQHNSQTKQNLSGHLHENIGFYSNITAEEYKQMVQKSIEYIKKGDIFQIVPSIRFYKQYNKHPLDFYKKLKAINPSPYMFYLSSSYNNERYNIIGASPEILINCRNNEITLRPLAGTIKRGQTPEEDKTNENILLADPKETSEHLMLLDLGRNDIGRIATKVWVEKQMVVEKYSHVMHISSTVKGTLDTTKTMVDVLKSGLPAGTLSGAPKIRAMQIISELETISRDFYAGTLGYISHNTLQTCIILRSALVKNGILYAQAGAGVVYDSIPENEYQECINKLKAIAIASE